MVFELGATEQTFPFIQAFLGGFFLWIGLNIRIIPSGDIEKDTE